MFLLFPMFCARLSSVVVVQAEIMVVMVVVPMFLVVLPRPRLGNCRDGTDGIGMLCTCSTLYISRKWRQCVLQRMAFGGNIPISTAHGRLFEADLSRLALIVVISKDKALVELY